MGNLRNAFRSFTHFVSGNMLVQLIGLITFPILTRVLARDEYGVLGIVTTTAMIAVAFSKAGLSDGIFRHYSLYNTSEEERTTFASTVFFRGVLFALVGASLYLLIVALLFRGNFFGDKLIAVTLLIMAGHVLTNPITIALSRIVRVEGKTILVNVLRVIHRALSAFLGLVILILVLKNVTGYFIGQVIADIVMVVIYFGVFLQSFQLSISSVSWKLTRSLVRFGLPILFSEVLYLVLSYADRYMILYFHGREELGLYTAGYNLAMYIGGAFLFSLSSTVVPMYVDIYSKEGRIKTEKFIAEGLHYVLIGCMLIFVMYSVVVKELFSVITSGKYVDAATFSPIILLGMLFLASNEFFKAGVYLRKRSGVITMAMLTAVIANIALNLYLIPHYGSLGASYATLAACVLAVFFTWTTSSRYLHIKALSVRLLPYTILGLFLFAIMNLIYFNDDTVRLLAKLLLGIILCLGGVIAFDKRIAKTAREMMGAIIGN